MFGTEFVFSIGTDGVPSEMERMGNKVSELKYDPLVKLVYIKEVVAVE